MCKYSEETNSFVIMLIVRPEIFFYNRAFAKSICFLCMFAKR